MNPGRYPSMAADPNSLHHEVAALWAEVFGRAPRTAANPSRMLDAVVRRLPVIKYERLQSAARASGLVWPAPQP